jgi:diphthine-ammonia ligase
MRKVALSWSGGKDACYALHKLHQAGIKVACLLTTIPKELNATFGHGEKRETIEAQGAALGIPVEWITCTFSTYGEDFVNVLKTVKEKYHIDGIAYGDLYLDEHRDWGEKIAETVEIEALYPLWIEESDSTEALARFVTSGYQAKVIRAQSSIFNKSWAGRVVDQQFYNDIRKLDICPMGEKGEYHTFVYDGPLFQKKIVFNEGQIEDLETTWRLHLEDIKVESK